MNAQAKLPAIGVLILLLTLGVGSAKQVDGQTPPGGQTVTYNAGWNLVAFPPGTDTTRVQGPLYTLQPGDTAYETVQPGGNTQSCVGYWAYFPTTTRVALGAGDTASCSITVPAGQWAMLGNPSGAGGGGVSGAEAVYAYDPAGGYQSRLYAQLSPGQGAWVFSARGGTITITPTEPGLGPRPPIPGSQVSCTPFALTTVAPGATISCSTPSPGPLTGSSSIWAVNCIGTGAAVSPASSAPPIAGAFSATIVADVGTPMQGGVACPPQLTAGTGGSVTFFQNTLTCASDPPTSCIQDLPVEWSFPISGGSAPSPTSLTDCGPIATAGSYVVAQNLTTASGDCIDVQAPDVSLDLGGYTLSGNGSGTGIRLLSGATGVYIHNGTVTGFGTGVEDDAGGNLIEALQSLRNQESGVYFNGINNGVSGSTVWRSTLSGNGRYGLYLSQSQNNSAITDVISQNGVDGIWLQASSSNLLSSNSVGGNGYAGILVGDAGDTLGTPPPSSCFGISLPPPGTPSPISANNIVAGNVPLDGNGTLGIGLQCGFAFQSIVANNTAVDNGSSSGGFDLYDGNGGCGADTWRNNSGMRNQDCIR